MTAQSSYHKTTSQNKHLSHLCLFGNLGHCLDTNNWEVSLGCFTGEHDTVRPVQDGICYVARLSPGRPGLLHHGLEHLGGADDGLSSTVALGDHRLLRDEHLLCWDLNPHIPTGHHQSLTASNDLGEVLDALLVFNLGNHPDVLPLLAQHIADLLDTVGIPDEGGKDHVNALLHPEQQIRLVLLRDGGQVSVGAWQVAALLGAKVSIILNHANEVVTANLSALDRDEAVVDEKPLADLHHLGDVLVVKPEDLRGTLLFERVICCDLD